MTPLKSIQAESEDAIRLIIGIMHDRPKAQSYL